MQDELNYLKMKDDLNENFNGRQPHFYKSRKISFLLSNGRQSQYSCECKTTSKINIKQFNLKQIKNKLYVVLKNNTITSNNTTTKFLLAQLKKH